ncbi:MAG: sugar transferase [Desulfosarcina sp.]|nr:sugar transferase [Desulfobacterales bacterium]
MQGGGHADVLIELQVPANAAGAVPCERLQESEQTMIQQQVYIINTVRICLDALCIIAAGYAAYYLTYSQADGVLTMSTNLFSGSVLIIMFINNYIMGKSGLYNDRRSSSLLNLYWSIIKCVSIDFTVLIAGIFILNLSDYYRVFFICFYVSSLLMLLLERSIIYFYASSMARNSFNARKILVVGDMERGRFVNDMLEQQLSWGHEVVGRLTAHKQDVENGDTLGTIDRLPEVLREYAIDEVIFTLDGDRTVNLRPHLDICKKMGIPARILPALWQPEGQGISVEICQNIPFFIMQTVNFNAAGLLYKRMLDLIGSMVGVIIFILIYPFVAIILKFDSEGPVLFKQKRMGKNGRIFNLYKFRTMYVDAEQRKHELMKKNVMNGAMFKLKKDPRITKAGRWLRKSSIDEIPQFLNVLKGEMSLVGTRPPTLDEVEKYQPEHLKRISAKPGITGLWQVSGRNKITDFEKIVELDCRYLDNWRFFDDIKLLFKTLWVVVRRKGAF